jgi:hypothetical protein
VKNVLRDPSKSSCQPTAADSIHWEPKNLSRLSVKADHTSRKCRKILNEFKTKLSLTRFYAGCEKKQFGGVQNSFGPADTASSERTNRSRLLPLKNRSPRVFVKNP